MIHIPLDQVEVSHLEALRRDGISESERLEFKSALNLDSPRDKKELAKDISGLANTVGGRIIYGLSEEDRNGEQVAGAITPLPSGDVRERYENIVVNAITPRPRFKTRTLPVKGGQVLVVEVYASAEADLHMVTLEKESRYYRRLSGRTVPMSEHELRDAYSHVTASKAQTDARLAELLQRELTIRKNAQRSILIFPVYPKPDLADPRITTGLRQQLALGPLRALDDDEVIYNMKPFGGGLRAIAPLMSSPESAEFYFAISRDGVHHLSHQRVIDTRPGPRLEIGVLYQDLMATIGAADLILKTLGYLAPVQVVLHLKTSTEALLWPTRGYAAISSGSHIYKVERIFLLEHAPEFGFIAKELLDQLYHDAGQTHCPLLDEKGNLLT